MIACCSIHSQNISNNIKINKDSLITITSEQLKITNLIFAEHKQYTELIPLLQKENNNLLIINNTWETTDSLKTAQIQQKQQLIEQQNQQIEKLRKSVKTSYKIGGSMVLISAVAILITILAK